MLRTSRLLILAGALGIAALVPTLASAQSDGISCWTRGAYLNVSNGDVRYGHKAVCDSHHTATVVLYRNGVPQSYYATVPRGTAGGNLQSEAAATAGLSCGVAYQVKVWVAELGDGQADVFYTSGAPQRLC